MTHLIILLDTTQNDRHKFREWGSKKNEMNLYFEPVEYLWQIFVAKIVNGSKLRSGSKHPSDERNKLFSFQIKATLKAITLGIRMCSTELLLWKNQKGSICYLITLFKWHSTADIFLEIFNFLWINYFKKQLQTTDCKGFFFCLECQMIIVFMAYRKSGTRYPIVGPGMGP